MIHCLAECKSLEYSGSFMSDRWVCGHQREIGVQTACLFVVVARAYLCNVLDAVALPAQYKTELAVDLESVKTVYNMTAGAFKPSAPFDIVLFVKAGFQFDKNIYLLAVFGCFNKAFYDFTVSCKPVQRHFYRDDTRIVRSFIQHKQERTYALIRIMKHLVAFLYLIEYRTALVEERSFHRMPWRIEKLGTAAELIADNREE